MVPARNAPLVPEARPVLPARRILFVITSLDFGGAEAVVVQLATRFVELGWQACVVSMTPPKAYEEKLVKAGVEVRSLGMKRGIPDPRALFRLARAYATYKPDVVHAHMVHAIILARAARLLAPVPALVSTAHTVEESSFLHYLGYRATDWLSELTTSVSKDGLSRYRDLNAIHPGKSVYLPNAVDLDRFGRSEAARGRIRKELEAGDRFVWLAVGRLTELKDYPNLLNALLLLPTKSRVWIAGEGELRGDVEEMIQELGLTERVQLLGVRTDVNEVMSAADGFVLSSVVEGLPMALLEAASSGLPAVATAVGGVADIVVAGSGHLVPPNNSVALAEAMALLERTPPAERELMGRKARQVAVASFDADNVMSTWEAVFEYLLTTSSGRRSRWAFGLESGALESILGTYLSRTD